MCWELVLVALWSQNVSISLILAATFQSCFENQHFLLHEIKGGSEKVKFVCSVLQK